MLRSELAGAIGRAGPAEDAYALQLAGQAPQLLKAFGDEPNPEALRQLSLVSGQRVIRHGRSPGVETAALLAEAALAHPENPVLSRLGERMVATVASSQRPDGTFSGGSGWTLQRLLVTTADCLRAVQAGAGVDAKARQRAMAAKVKASGAFERNFERVQDAYTAAAILASGGVEGVLAEKLRARVRDAVKGNEDGSRELPVDEGVVRPDGRIPSVSEATARAALALEGDAAAPWRADLGAKLLSTYSPGWGWGDGQTNLVALRAVLALFKEPLPAKVRIVLEMDGEPVTEGTLETSRTKDVLTLEAAAPKAAGSHRWTVRAEPAVPGLGFSFALNLFVPWEQTTREHGLELAVEKPDTLEVGKPADIAIDAAAPAHLPLTLRHALPAGGQGDRPALDALVGSGALTSYRVEDGAVTMEIAPLSPGRSFAARYRVIPTLAGKLHAGITTLAPADNPDEALRVPPAAWAIR